MTYKVKSIKTVFKNITLLVSFLFLYGCQQAEENKSYSYKIDMIESEEFVEPYPTRIIVTPEYLRYDDGEGSNDYVLLDRTNNIIYSVNSDDETVISISEKNSATESPIKLEVKLKKIGELADAPKIDNKMVVHYQIVVNDKACYNVATVENLMPEAVVAFQEFVTLAASDSKHTFGNIPADLHDACEMVMTAFSPAVYLQNGFPIMEWGRARKLTKRLIDYDLKFVADAKLFVLPGKDEYHYFSVQDMREGKVNFNDEPDAANSDMTNTGSASPDPTAMEQAPVNNMDAENNPSVKTTP